MLVASHVGLNLISLLFVAKTLQEGGYIWVHGEVWNKLGPLRRNSPQLVTTSGIRKTAVIPFLSDAACCNELQQL